MNQYHPETKAILFRLKNARVHRRLRQDQVAERMGIPRPSYSLIEAGKQRLTVPNLLNFADALAVPAQWLLLGTASVGGEVRKYDRLWQLPSLPELTPHVPRTVEPEPVGGTEERPAKTLFTPVEKAPTRATPSPARGKKVQARGATVPASGAAKQTARRSDKGKGPKTARGIGNAILRKKTTAKDRV